MVSEGPIAEHFKPIQLNRLEYQSDYRRSAETAKWAMRMKRMSTSGFEPALQALQWWQENLDVVAVIERAVHRSKSLNKPRMNNEFGDDE